MKAALAFAAVALLVAVAAQKPFTGYIVTGQWDGRTVPSPQWALDVTRQTTQYRSQEELVLQKLIPATAGDALSPQFSAYDAKTRTYFLTSWLNDTSAALWGMTIANDVGSATPLSPQVAYYSFPSQGQTLVGLQVWNNNGALTPLVFYANGTVMSVNYQTGATAVFANLVNYTRTVTTAIEINPDAGEIYAITQNVEGAPERQCVTLTLATGNTFTSTLQPLKNHDPMVEQPFEMVWMPSLQTLMVFYTGDQSFDQLIYTEPRSGMTSMAIMDLSQYGQQGHFEFTKNDFLEDDDTWTDAVIDNVANKIYFQCSDVDPDTGFATTTLCEIPTPTKIAPLNFVNTAIWPMTYGYVGMQYVQVVS